MWSCAAARCSRVRRAVSGPSPRSTAARIASCSASRCSVWPMRLQVQVDIAVGLPAATARSIRSCGGGWPVGRRRRGIPCWPPTRFGHRCGRHAPPTACACTRMSARPTFGSGDPGGHRLDRLAQVVQLLNSSTDMLVTTAVAFASGLDQPFTGEDLERVAHRDPADAESLGEADLRELGAGGEIAVQDLGTQLRRDSRRRPLVCHTSSLSTIYRSCIQGAGRSGIDRSSGAAARHREKRMSWPVSRILFLTAAQSTAARRRPSIWTHRCRVPRAAYPQARASSPRTPARPHQVRPSWPCFGWGLPSHSGHPECWCALTAPFHPYHREGGGLFSVALSRESPRIAVSNHPAL